MKETDTERRLREISFLRSQGLVTPQEAYELHMEVLSSLSPPVPPPTATVEVLVQPTIEAGARLRWDVLALVLAVLGGLLGIVGAFLQELQSGGGGIVGAFVAAPIIEEALKPAGVYILLIRWPQAIRNQLHTASLAAISGLSFGIVEALVYVLIYVPDGNSDFVLYRFTFPLAMHTAGSFIVGMGLSYSLIDWANGKQGFPRRFRNCYLGAVGLHTAYNITAVALSLSGVLDFE